MLGDSNGVCFGEWEDDRVCRMILEGLPTAEGGTGETDEGVGDDHDILLFKLPLAGALFWTWLIGPGIW